MKKALILLVTLVCCCQGICQYQIGLIPRISPDKAVYQKVGFTEIEIRYGSPRVKDRIIWGGLEPFDVPWRAGANKEDSFLKAGTYAFFIIPRKEEKWTLIFSENEKQWGAFSYKEEEDVLRIEVESKVIPFQENLTYEIEGDVKSGAIHFKWEKVGLSFEVKTNPIKGFQNLIEERFEAAENNLKFVVLIQGAEFLAKQNELVKY